MRTRRLVWIGGTLLLLFVAGCAALVFIPVPARFTLADYERVKMGMTVEEVEATLGPQVPDEKSVLGNRSNDLPPCWKAWGDDVEQLHVRFDAEGQVEGWVVHPLRPRLIDHVRAWLRQ